MIHYKIQLEIKKNAIKVDSICKESLIEIILHVFVPCQHKIVFFFFASLIRSILANRLSAVMSRPDPYKDAAIFFTTSLGLLLTKKRPISLLSYRSLHIITGAKHFIQYLLGFDEMYCRKGHFPRKPGSISLIVSFSLGM